MFFAKTIVAEHHCHNRVNKIHLPNLMLAAAAEPDFLGIFGIEKTITLNGMGWVWTPLRLYGRHGDRAKLSQSSHGTLFCTRSASVSFWKDVHAKSKQPAIQRMQSNKQHFSREKFVYGSIKKRYSSLMMVDYQSQAFLPGKDDGLYNQYLNQYFGSSKTLSYSTILSAHFRRKLRHDGNSSMFVSVHPWYSSIRGFSHCAIFSISKQKDASFERSQVFFYLTHIKNRFASAAHTSTIESGCAALLNITPCAKPTNGVMIMCDLNLTGVEKLHKTFLLRVLRLARATACAPGHCQKSSQREVFWGLQIFCRCHCRWVSKPLSQSPNLQNLVDNPF